MIGAIQDILGTLDVKAVQNDKALKSAIVSWINTILSWVAFYYIIQSPDYLVEILAYATGGAFGAYYIIKKKLY